MIPNRFVRADGNYDMDAASLESALFCEDESRAQQSAADETDINTIVRRFGITGHLPTGIVVPTFGDFEGVSDFKSAMDVVANANEAFDAMPAEVRARFKNDTQAFVEFVYDDRNYDEAVRMGVVLPERSAARAEAARLAQAPAVAAAPAIAAKVDQ